MTIPDTERSIEYDRTRITTIPLPRVPTRECPLQMGRNSRI